MEDYIIVGFSTHKTFNVLSKLIQLVEHTDFSHVYIRFYSKSIDRYLIYQASGLQVNFCGLEHFYEKNKTIAEFRIKVDPETKRQLLMDAVDLAGKPYGMKDLIGIGLVRFCSLFKIKIKNPFADGSKTYICSELASTFLVKLGYTIQDLDSATPKDVYDILRGQSNGQNLKGEGTKSTAQNFKISYGYQVLTYS